MIIHSYPKLVNIPEIDGGGAKIGVLEMSTLLGFPVKRMYFLHRVDDSVKRGNHAHKELFQCFIALKGSFKIELEGAAGRHVFVISSPKEALIVPPGYWRVLSEFSEGTVCAVLASEEYNEGDYIRNYKNFESYIKSSKDISSVPYLDLTREYQDIKLDLYMKYDSVLSSGNYISGDSLKEFESRFAEMCGSKFCVGVSNGLDALTLTLTSWGITEPGIEVICAANSFVATAIGISRAGATPVFVDPDHRTYNICPKKIEEKINNNTKAIVLTHMYGQPADMDRINYLAEKYGLKVFEDSAQAHYAEYKGKRCGSLGDAAGFSFYPTKNLGAFGDGGAITTDDESAYNHLLALRNYGSIRKYKHDILGYNARLDELQAAFLSVKLKKIESWTEHRRDLAKLYVDSLSDVEGIILPFIPEGYKPVWHVFAIRVLNGLRDNLAEYLEKNNIGYNIHYPIPIHLQKCYRDLGYEEGSLPVSERVSKEVLSLPLSSYHSHDEILYVVKKIKEFFG